MNIGTLLDHAARRFADRGAVYHGAECVQTYAVLQQRARALAAGLLARGLGRQRVVVVSENQPAYLEILFGIWAAGRWWCPSTPSCTPARRCRSSTTRRPG